MFISLVDIQNTRAHFVKGEDKKLGKSVKIYSRTKISFWPVPFYRKTRLFYQENQANENLPRNYYYAYPLYCAHSLWSCNKVLSGRGQGYFCARDELSISFWNLSAWNLYMSPLICCWSMKSTKCFFLLSEICFEFDTLIKE